MVTYSSNNWEWEGVTWHSGSINISGYRNRAKFSKIKLQTEKSNSSTRFCSHIAYITRMAFSRAYTSAEAADPTK